MDKSLKQAILIYLAMSMLVVCGCGVLYLTYTSSKMRLLAFQERSGLFASSQASSIAQSVWDYNDTAVQNALGSMTKYPNVLSVTVVDNVGKEQFKAENPVKYDGKKLTISGSIMRQDTSLGKLEFVFSLDSLDAENKDELMRLILFGCSNFSIVMILIFVYLNLIFGPLNTIKNVMGKIASGYLETPVTYEKANEIGSLADSLRRMVSNLKFKIAESNQKKLDADQAKQEAESAKENAEKALTEAQKSKNEADFSKSNAEEAKHQAEDAKHQAELAQKRAETAKQEGMLVAAQQLESIVKFIASASAELMIQINSSEKGSSEQLALLTETAKAMQEMNFVVLDVSKNIASTAEVSTLTRKNAIDGSSIVKEVISSINQVGQEALLLKQNMATLESQTQAVSTVMSLISNIADQTNLLALNASIEASRAGQAGLSFAVVAEEVRKLAEKTMHSTVDVGKTVSQMQESAQNSVLQVDLTVKTIQKATELAGKSGKALEYIVGQVDKTAEQVRAIAAACEEQSATTGHINNSVSHVTNISVTTAKSMQESARAVSNLSLQSQDLTQLIEKMKHSYG